MSKIFLDVPELKTDLKISGYICSHLGEIEGFQVVLGPHVEQVVVLVAVQQAQTPAVQPVHGQQGEPNLNKTLRHTSEI